MPRWVQTPSGPLYVADEALPPDVQALVGGLPPAEPPGGGGGVGPAGLAASALGSALPGAAPSGPKVVAEDDATLTVAIPGEPRGRVIAKAGLTPEKLAELRGTSVQSFPEAEVVGIPPTPSGLTPGVRAMVEQSRAGLRAPEPVPPADDLVTGGAAPAAGGGPLAGLRGAVSGSVETSRHVAPAARPAPMDSLAGLERDALRAAEASGEAVARGAERQADAVGGVQRQLQAHQADVEAEAEADRIQLEEREAEINAAQREAAEKAQLNPRRVFDQMSTGQQAMGFFGLVLGGIGGALTRSPNAALAVLENAIDRDIEAQRDEYERAKDKIAMQEKSYGLLRQRIADRKTAELAYKEHILEMADLELQRLGSLATSDQARANIQTARVGIREKYDETRFGRRMQLSGLLLNERQMRLDEAKFAASLTAGQGQRDPTVIPFAFMPDGTPARAATSKRADTLSETIADARVVAGIAAEGEELRDRLVTAIQGGNLKEAARVRSEIKRWRAAGVNAVKNFRGFGAALTETEQALVEAEAALDAGEIGFFRSRLADFQNSIYREVQNKVSTFAPGAVFDPNALAGLVRQERAATTSARTFRPLGGAR